MKLQQRTVAGEPTLECLADSMSIYFNTEKEFEGHVYVKGHYDDSLCRVDATLRKNVNLTVPFSMCDVRRQRSVSYIKKFIFSCIHNSIWEIFMDFGP